MPCIFCLASTPKGPLTDEHILPRSIGGTLVLRNSVCDWHNNQLGAHVDSELFRIPEIFDGLKAVGIPADYGAILRQNYRATGTGAGISLKGRWEGETVSFPMQKIDDGSEVLPESQLEEVLRKRINREKGTGYQGAVEDLLDRYKSLEPGQTVRSDELNLTLLKRRDRLNIKVERKSPANLDALIAKIAFEFLFLVSGREVLLNQDLTAALVRTVEGSKSETNGRVSF